MYLPKQFFMFIFAEMKKKRWHEFFFINIDVLVTDIGWI